MSRDYKCDNCDERMTAAELNVIKRYSERVDEDGEEPAGECPHCGCLAYYNAEEDEDPAADRGDWEFHRDHDQ